ncbi:hypothetical protein [Ignatzschineria sp. LJL83]
MKKVIMLGAVAIALLTACGEDESKTNEPIRITDQGTGADDTMRKIEARKQKQREAKELAERDKQFEKFLEELENSME